MSAEQHVKDIQKITADFSKKLLQAYFVSVDEKVMDFADRAKSNIQQMQLMEVSRNLKQHKGEMLVLFQESLASGFSLFRQGKLQSETETREDLSPNLSLVADEKLEEDIAINSLSRRAETRHNEDLFALDHRLALLIGGRKLPEGGNPIGPSQFATALKQALPLLNLEVKITVLFYKLFEKQLLPELETLYKDVNERLINAGILPNLRYSLERRKGTQSAPQIPGAPQTSSQPEPDPNSNTAWQNALPSTAMPIQPQVFTTPVVSRGVAASITPPDSNLPTTQYQEQLFSAIQNMQQTVIRPAQVGPAVSSTDLVNVIQHVQTQTINPEHFDADNIAPCATVSSGLTGERIQSEVSEASGKNIANSDANTIDLVGMIFEYMLGDEDLPDNVKAVLSYLHTPYLKIAFLNTDLFSKTDHPARLLLNKLAETGSKWVNNDGTSQFKAFPKIKSIVRRILLEFTNDLSMLEDLLSEAQEFHSKVERNVELLEKRASQKAEGEDRLRSVKRLVNVTVKERMHNKKLPSPIIVLLLHPWSEYLTFILLRHGEKSKEWQQSVQIVDDIIWSIGAKSKPEDKKRLMVLQETLQNELQDAFNSIGYDQAKGDKLLDAIHELQVIALQNKSVQPASAKAKKEIEETAVGRKEAEEEDAAVNLTHEERELVGKLKMVEFGTWLEFDNLDGLLNQRVKIAWFNSRSMRYMLVNRAGKQVAMLTAVEIARQMLAKNTRIISGTAKPFFERALVNIFTRLRSNAA